MFTFASQSNPFKFICPSLTFQDLNSYCFKYFRLCAKNEERILFIALKNCNKATGTFHIITSALSLFDAFVILLKSGISGQNLIWVILLMYTVQFLLFHCIRYAIYHRIEKNEIVFLFYISLHYFCFVFYGYIVFYHSEVVRKFKFMKLVWPAWNWNDNFLYL